jgi:S-adenosylmethionine:tRNA ribosyltransferase-isomerase
MNQSQSSGYSEFSIHSAGGRDRASSLSSELAADFCLSAYDYDLPADRIAQNPADPRDSSRLLVIDSPHTHRHCIFRDLVEILHPGDLLVLNNTRVIPARLYGYKIDGQTGYGPRIHADPSGTATQQTGAKIEVLLLEERQPQEWLALVKPGKRMKPGTRIAFSRSPGSPDQPTPEESDFAALTATVEAIDDATGGRWLRFDLPPEQPLLPLIAQYGVVPLPPYITQSQADPERYQTVYSDRLGAVAAPTAGLHFTPELLARLRKQGIQQAFVTLHVGVGTFRPVEAEDITQHQMHGEWLEVSQETVEQIQQTRAKGGRIIAVGTTAVRSLEGAAQGGTLQPYCGKTELFIYPGYSWRVVDGLITNFHLPKSSLLMLVSALIGRPRLLDLYQEAIAQQYRFYSFGDAMLILPEAKQPTHRPAS